MNALGKQVEVEVEKKGKNSYCDLEGRRIPSRENDSKENDKVLAFIYKDHDKKLQATIQEPKIILGQIRPLRVVSIMKVGAFVDIGIGQNVLCSFTEQVYPLKEGSVQLSYLYINKSNRLALTSKIKDHLKGNRTFRLGDQVKGVVYHHKAKLGYFVAIDYQYNGLIPEKGATGIYITGEEVQGRVIFAHEDGRIIMTTKAFVSARLEKDAQTLLTILKHNKGHLDLGGRSSPEKIYRATKLSKKAFKRAAGRLYKNHLATIKDCSIDLIK